MFWLVELFEIVVKYVFVVYKEKNFCKWVGNIGLIVFGKCICCCLFVFFFILVGFCLFFNGNMKFIILEFDGKVYDFVLIGDKLG